jgi:hypothetical protein
MPGVFVAMDTCYVHKGLFEFDPDTVVTVWVDPETNMPYDVREDPDTGKAVSVQPPPPPMPPGAVQRFICDPCIRLINARRVKPPIPLAADQPGGTWNVHD